MVPGMSGEVVHGRREPPNRRRNLWLAKAAVALGALLFVTDLVVDESWSNSLRSLASVLLFGGLVAWGVGSLARRSSAALQIAVILDDDDIRVLQGGEQLVVAERSAIDHARWVEVGNNHWLALLDRFGRTVASIPAGKLDRDDLIRLLALHRWPAPRPAEALPPAGTATDRFVSDQVDHKIGTWFLGGLAAALVLVGFSPWVFEGMSESQRWIVSSVTVPPVLVLVSLIPGRLKGYHPATLEVDAEFVWLVPPKGREVVVPRGPVAQVSRTAYRHTPVLDFRDVTQVQVEGLGVPGFDLDDVMAALRRHGWPVSE